MSVDHPQAQVWQQVHQQQCACIVVHKHPPSSPVICATHVYMQADGDKVMQDAVGDKRNEVGRHAMAASISQQGSSHNRHATRAAVGAHRCLAAAALGPMHCRLSAYSLLLCCSCCCLLLCCCDHLCCTALWCLCLACVWAALHVLHEQRQ